MKIAIVVVFLLIVTLLTASVILRDRVQHAEDNFAPAFLAIAAVALSVAEVLLVLIWFVVS